MSPSAPEDEQRLSLEAAAQLLQVSERTIRRWIEKLEMPQRLDAGQLSFSRSDLLDWANGHSVRLAADVACEEDEQIPLPKLGEAIARGGIHRAVQGTSVERVLENASMAITVPEAIDREFFHQVLLAREDLDSTGIGRGFAVPHVRAPLVLHVVEPYVGLVFLQNPVDWHALDGKPVDTLFVLVCPGLRSHLHLLRRIAQVLHDDVFCELLIAQADDAAIMQRLAELDRSER